MAKSGGRKRRPQGCSLRSHRLRRLKPLTPTLSPATHSAMPSMLPCCTSDLKRRQMLSAALVGFITFLLNTKNFSVTAETFYFWLLAMFGFTTLAYYLIYDILEAVYAVRSIEAYISNIETTINQIAGAKVLFWQSEIASFLWSISYRIGEVLPPMRCLEIYELILILGTTVILPLYVYYQIWALLFDDPVTAGVLLILSIYSLGSALVVVYVWRGVNTRLPDEVLRLARRLTCSCLPS